MPFPFPSGLHRGLPQGPAGAQEEARDAPDGESGDRMGVHSTGEESAPPGWQCGHFHLYFLNLTQIHLLSISSPDSIEPQRPEVQFPQNEHRRHQIQRICAACIQLEAENNVKLQTSNLCSDVFVYYTKRTGVISTSFSLAQ